MENYCFGNYARSRSAIRLGENERLSALSVCLASVPARRTG